MSAVHQAREGYPAMLAALLADLAPYFRLYSNDPPVGLDRVAADFVPCIIPGCEGRTVTRWSPTALREGRAFAVIDPVIFTYTTGETGPPARGYYVTAGPDGPLLWWWQRPGEPWQPTEDDPHLVIFFTVYWPPVV